MRSVVYIKPVTWAGVTNYFLGLRPSRPRAEPSRRLNGYFLVVNNLQTARAVARHEADRLGCGRGVVVLCENYVGL